MIRAPGDPPAPLAVDPAAAAAGTPGVDDDPPSWAAARKRAVVTAMQPKKNRQSKVCTCLLVGVDRNPPRRAAPAEGSKVVGPAMRIVSVGIARLRFSAAPAAAPAGPVR